VVRGAAAVGLRRGFATARSATAYAAGNSPWSVDRDFAKCFRSGTLLHVVDGHGVALMIYYAPSMGYAFEFERPAPGGSFGLSNWQMSFAREVMREAGAVAGQGLGQALSMLGFEPEERTVDVEKFLSTSEWHVSADEALFIASRLRLAASKHLIAELMSFCDDAHEDVGKWIDDFARFNELSAAHDGYRVR
jgi:hypothetical protein